MCSLALDQAGRLNLGQDVGSLRFFTICGLQEGFEPFAINMKRPIALWVSKSLPQFGPIDPQDPELEVGGPMGCGAGGGGGTGLGGRPRGMGGASKGHIGVYGVWGGVQRPYW